MVIDSFKKCRVQRRALALEPMWVKMKGTCERCPCTHHQTNAHPHRLCDVAAAKRDGASGGGVGTWRNESRPSLAPEPFAHLLKSWPATPARPRSVETHFSQTPGVGQVGQIQLDLPAVEVEWQEVLRMQAPFGDRAVPLRIRGLARRILRRITYPITAASLCFDPKLHRGSGDAGILDLRDQLRDLPVLAAGDQINRLFIIQG